MRRCATQCGVCDGVEKQARAGIARLALDGRRDISNDSPGQYLASGFRLPHPAAFVPHIQGPALP